MKTLPELRAEYEEALRLEEAAKDAEAIATLAAKKAHLALLEAEGKGECADARWIRAFFAHDHTTCRRILAEMYPRRFVEDASEANAIIAEMRTAVVVEHCNGIPVTVDR